MNTIEDILSNALFYPACGDDGLPVKYFNEHYSEYGIDSHVYVDYAMNEDRLRELQDGFRYYHVVSETDLEAGDLVVPGSDYTRYASILTSEEVCRMKEIVYGMYRDSIKPFGRLIRYERNVDSDPSRGPEHFTLLYIGAEAVAAYAALYRTRGIAPKAIAIIAPGTGFGGNYTDFYDPESAFMKIVSQGEARPQFFLFGYDRILRFEDYMKKKMSMTKECVEKKKAEFKNRYDGKNAEDLAVLAAVQHGYLYSPDLTEREREDIRKKWKEELKRIGEKYAEARGLEEFISDIVTLRHYMNEAFPDSFNNTKDGYENGFRIAHAQKSLSIYLKHCWCRGMITPIPPTCPVDGNVLSWVEIKSAWTKCNWVDDCDGEKYSGYRSQMNHIRSMASKEAPGLSVFEWELCKFKSEAEKRAEKGHAAPKPGDRPSRKVDLKQEAAKWYDKNKGKYKELSNPNKESSGEVIYLRAKLNDGILLELGVNIKRKKQYCFCRVTGISGKKDLSMLSSMLKYHQSNDKMYSKDEYFTKDSLSIFEHIIGNCGEKQS